MGRSLLIALLAASAAEHAHAIPPFLVSFHNTYPVAAGSRIDGCSLCHTDVPQLNPYGRAFSNAGNSFAAIEGLDSDGDGASNLTEIDAQTFPGDPSDVPPLATPTPTATPTETSTPGPCVGDCNQNGAVTVDEVVRAVRIALGIGAVGDCSSIDHDGDGTISISELLLAVSASLNSCS